jgi:hypothetical protein
VFVIVLFSVEVVSKDYTEAIQTLPEDQAAGEPSPKSPDLRQSVLVPVVDILVTRVVLTAATTKEIASKAPPTSDMTNTALLIVVCAATPTNQPIKHSANQAFKQPTSQSSNQSINYQTTSQISN